jgi:hypothetical protein
MLSYGHPESFQFIPPQIQVEQSEQMYILSKSDSLRENPQNENTLHPKDDKQRGMNSPLYV